jgi:hypothetical protein
MDTRGQQGPADEPAGQEATPATGIGGGTATDPATDTATVDPVTVTTVDPATTVATALALVAVGAAEPASRAAVSAVISTVAPAGPEFSTFAGRHADGWAQAVADPARDPATGRSSSLSPGAATGSDAPGATGTGAGTDDVPIAPPPPVPPATPSLPPVPPAPAAPSAPGSSGACAAGATNNHGLSVLPLAVTATETPASLTGSWVHPRSGCAGHIVGDPSEPASPPD